MRVKTRINHLFISFLVLLLGMSSSGTGEESIRIAQEDSFLAYASDLSCSYYIWEGDFPDLIIADWEKNSGRTLLTLGDVIYTNKIEAGALQVDQFFSVIEIGPAIGRYGRLAYQRGRVRIQALEGDRAATVIESACGPIRLGLFLIPFVEKAAVTGKDLGFDVKIAEGEGQRGRFLYLQDGYAQVGTGHWAIISLGRDNGVDIGDQLLACRKSGKDALLAAFANCVVLDVGTRTATVKIISSRDAITLDDWVVSLPERRFNR